MFSTVSKKDTVGRPKTELQGIIGSKIRPNCTTKNLEKHIVWFGLKQALNRCGIMDDTAGKNIDQVGGWHGSIGKECKSYFNDMPMLSFGGLILLTDMRTGYSMRDSYPSEKRIKGLILPTLISLHGNNFLVKLPVY